MAQAVSVPINLVGCSHFCVLQREDSASIRMGKSCQLALLKQGAGQRINVDLEDGATVGDLLTHIANLKEISVKELFVVGQNWMDRVKLNKNEQPSGDIFLGGVD